MCDSCVSWPAPACECIRFGRDSGPRGEVQSGRGVRASRGLVCCGKFCLLAPLLSVVCSSSPSSALCCSVTLLLRFSPFSFSTSRRRSGQAELSHPEEGGVIEWKAFSLGIFHVVELVKGNKSWIVWVLMSSVNGEIGSVLAFVRINVYCVFMFLYVGFCECENTSIWLFVLSEFDPLNSVTV